MSDEPVIYEDKYTWPLDGTGPNFSPPPAPSEDYVYPEPEAMVNDQQVVPDDDSEPEGDSNE